MVHPHKGGRTTPGNIESDVVRVRQCVQNNGILENGESGSEFYYCHASLCVLDAVYSIRARYEGVRNVIDRYCEHYHVVPTLNRENGYTENEDTLDRLAQRITAVGCETFAGQIVHNRTKTAGRLKSEVVLDVSRKLINGGITSLRELSEWAGAVDAHAFSGDILGIGPVTVTYLAMLTGNETLVKVDIHVRRFMQRCLGRDADDREILEILREVARQLGVVPRMLDNCIWRYERRRKA